jgi:hypothetical protein
MFKITRGKGFHMTFDNGWTVSVQWGAGNYCDHYSTHLRTGEDYDRADRDVGSNGSMTAEIAAWDKDGTWFDFGHDQVHGYVPADDVLAFMTMIASK